MSNVSQIREVEILQEILTALPEMEMIEDLRQRLTFEAGEQ
jgi:hypothetical protein